MFKLKFHCYVLDLNYLSAAMTKEKRYYYLIEFQYLGFRYHGWAKQPDVKTVQGMVNRTLKYILGEARFKTLGAGRTDAMVSANQGYFELFVYEPLEPGQLLQDLNTNLPHDIHALSIEEVDGQFNVIQDVKEKEYTYLFSFGKKNHPYAAPYMVFITVNLDVELMKQGAKLFEGTHDFRQYCYQPKPETSCIRTINASEIGINDILTASFFPAESFVYKVKGSGFMRNQVRLIMGTLISLGKGELSLEDIRISLKNPEGKPLYYIAPASGLMLNSVQYK
jgi:tRNA pseudouridine38-40 synthase